MNNPKTDFKIEKIEEEIILPYNIKYQKIKGATKLIMKEQ